MAYEFQDIDPENIDFKTQSDDARKKRLQLLAALATGGASEAGLGDLAGQALTERANKATDRMEQIGQALTPQQPVQPQQTQPVGPVMPQEIAQQRPAMPGQTPEEQKLTQEQFQQQQAQQQMGPAMPVNPAEVQLPQAGPGVQVAGTQPGAGVQEAVQAQQPMPSQTPDWHDKLVGSDFNNLSNLLADPNTPEDVKSEAQDRMYNMLNDKRLEAKATQTIDKAMSGDPRAANDLTKELTKRSTEGSMLKAVLYSRLGLADLAKDEQAKLGAGQKFTSFVGNNGQHFTVKLDSDGLVTKAFDESGKQVDDKTLAGLNASFLQNKNAMYTGGTKVYTVPKGDQNEGQEYTSRFNTHTGRFENILTTGPNAGQLYGGAPGLEKRVETSAAIAENKLGTSKQLVDYRLQQNLKYAGPMAYTKAGAHYVGRYNAENGTNLGYNREGVLVDHNNDNKPVVQNKDGSIAAVQRVENKPEAAPTKVPAAAPAPAAAAAATPPAPAASAEVQPSALTTNLGQPPAYDKTLTPLQNQQIQKNWAANRKKVTTDFITGKQGQTVQSMNVAVDHLDSLQQAANALNNGDVKLFNQIGNAYSRNTGSPAVTDFNAMKSIVGSEVAKAVAGGATALGDREEIRQEINAANSPAQLAGVIEKYQRLLAGQVKGLRQTFVGAGLPEQEFDNKLLPRTKQVLGRISNESENIPTTPAEKAKAELERRKKGQQ